MITGNKDSKNPASGELVDIRKYSGVASISVLALNPNNAKLRSYGWQIPEGADEPNYTNVDKDGRKSFRLRMLVQIHDLDEKPVIALDYWLSPEVMFNKDRTKCKVIDSFGRTAWGTKAEIQGHKIPMFSNGNYANISSDYKPCHGGEEEVVAFLMKFLNVTPLQIFDRKKNAWINSKDPGHVTIDSWANLCNGNLSEIKAAIAMQPENRVKVILGIRTTDENKSYQTFLPTTYIGNGSIPDRNTGEYTSARKAIDRYFTSLQQRSEKEPTFVMPNVEFSAAPVKEWNVTATEVADNADTNEAPSFDSPEYTKQVDDDLPFGDNDAF